MENFFLIVLLLIAVFLILLVLVQRGRGGGLAGALGGPGGSSAFGAKAGDTFTKITIWAASIWIVTCIVASYWASHRADPLGADSATPVVNNLDLGAGGEDATPEGDAGAAEAPEAEAPAESADAENE